jgi:hypothetical protein
MYLPIYTASYRFTIILTDNVFVQFTAPLKSDLVLSYDGYFHLERDAVQCSLAD